MTRGIRLAVGAVGGLLVAGALVWAISDIPAFGHYDHRYGALAARQAVPARSATNAVVVTAFDFRGFDTLGEEFILFVAALAVLVLLRRLRADGREDDEAEATSERRYASELQRWGGRALLGPTLLLAAYIVTHGQLTPGGGFQGGVLLAGAVVAMFVGGEYGALLRMREAEPLEAAEAMGAAGFVLLALGGLIASGVLLQNFIAKGTSGLLTGGFIPVANIVVGIEVGGATLLIIAELLDQRRLVA